MKIIRLDRRHLAHRLHDHVVGFRFEQYSCKSRRQIERACRNLFEHWLWPRQREWTSYFGSKNTTGFRTYWITFLDEASLTAVLLKASYTEA